VKVEQTGLPGVLLIEPQVYSDERGFFLEVFHELRFAEHGLPTRFRQDNHSRSTKGVLRGLHYQRNRPQGKLVTVVRGVIFDVAVDVRRGSPNFAKWYGTTMTGDEPRYMWIPPGFAHGFCVISDIADVAYKCTELYSSEDEAGIPWNDPAIGIDWPVDAPRLSAKDQRYAQLTTDRTDLPLSR
jgi:dTDP-4-dehydrorhamnose 3,5-epimerase